MLTLFQLIYAYEHYAYKECTYTEENTWHHTFVCTIAGRWARKPRTVWKTSTAPSTRTLSIMLHNAMKTPVRPTPVLKKYKYSYYYVFLVSLKIKLPVNIYKH